PEALDVLIQAARSEGSGDRAIRHLGDLGPRAGPAADVLMDALADGDVNVLRVVGAIVAVAPDRTPAVLATLVGRAASEDVQVARAVDQLVAGLKWIHREDSRQGAGGSGPPRGVPEFVVPIVGISGGTRLRALAVLTEIARGENDGPARRAVEVLRDLGPAAGPAADDLMAILREKDLRRPRVAAAVVATSPALLPTVVSLLANLAVSGDETDARFADRELVNLSQNDGPVPGRLPESPAVVSTLVAALEARPASDGAGLAAALRRIDGPAARKAYNAFVRRERIEARESGSE
ncbi:hypothetical protein HOI71_06570, partial [Candidatus Poribacteria bacterium]|nr:hypothetical protein [Candidatus Poribacteria bacterium]